MKEVNYVKSFVMIAFLLLGVLFGMVIMSFIFGNIGTSNVATLTNPTTTVTALSGAYINQTLYSIPEASTSTFLSWGQITAVNASSGEVIGSGNYTVDTTGGTITNATITVWSNVNLTYTYTYKSEQRVAIENTNNNSLQAIVTYSNQASTQFNTVAIAITLLVLIVLFLIFWIAFIKPMMNTRKKGGGNFA